MDDIINSINILAFKATDAVERGLLSANPSDLGFEIPSTGDEAAAVQAAKLEIESGVHQLETLLEAKIDKNFDKMELYTLRNILGVPAEARDWVRLSHYEGLNFAPPKDGEEAGPSMESVKLQRKRLRETMKLHALLKAEADDNERVLAEMRKLLLGRGKVKTEDGDDEKDNEMGMKKEEAKEPYPTFAFLQEKGELTGDVKRPLSTTTSFALSQLPALKDSLQDFGPRLDELANGDGKDGTLVGEEEKSWRRQRLEFVELEARRHLEGVRGLELGDMGEVRDGEWQGEGRRLVQGEVGDLERVVGLVGGAEGADADKANESEAMDEGA